MSRSAAVALARWHPFRVIGNAMRSIQQQQRQVTGRPRLRRATAQQRERYHTSYRHRPGPRAPGLRLLMAQQDRTA